MQDDELEPAELKEVVTTTKLMTEVVTAAATTITVATTLIIAAIITVVPSVARRRKGVVIRDPEETATPSIIIHSEPKSKDKGKGIMRKEKEDNVMLRYQALKRKPHTEAQSKKNMMIYLRNMAGFKMDYFKGISYDDIRPIFEKYFNSKVAFLEKTKEQIEEEDSRPPKRKTESSEEKAANKQNLDEEVPVVNYAIYTKNNKPYYKIIRADGSHELFLSFLSLLRNFDREDMEPDVQAQVWKNQRSVHGLAKMILLVERRYLLTRFTLGQMLNNVRLEVEEESEVSLELLRFVQRQQQEAYIPE
nr:hypothetical protein [Tanacetum cinerariifolium]